MDTVETLARDLAIAHWELGSEYTWRASIRRAVAGSNHALTALCGTALIDRALALVSRLREEREHAPVQGNGVRSSAVASSPAVIGFDDLHSSNLQRPENAEQFQ